MQYYVPGSHTNNQLPVSLPTFTVVRLTVALVNQRTREIWNCTMEVREGEPHTLYVVSSRNLVKLVDSVISKSTSVISIQNYYIYNALNFLAVYLFLYFLNKYPIYPYKIEYV